MGTRLCLGSCTAAALLTTIWFFSGSMPARAADEAKTTGGPAVLPAPLVYLRDIDPSILQDIRYAGNDNFTGAPVPGYGASECILTRTTAMALADVQRQLVGRGLSLKVYDCYRPVRSVETFMRWTRASAGDERTSRFHPSVPRSKLAALGYIAAHSGHSRGHTVDLTLVAMPRQEVPAYEARRSYGACTASQEARAPDDSLDMGTGFDCFDAASFIDSKSISARQAENRGTLAKAMTRAGFVPYSREWWHYSFPSGDPGHTFNVDVIAHP